MRKTVGIDSSFLIVFLNKKARASIPNGAELVEDLIAELSEQRSRVVLPANVLTEILIQTPSIQTYLEAIKKYSCFQVKSFDEKAAIELAMVLRSSVQTKKRKAKQMNKQSVTFDRQIVAVCKVNHVKTLYSDDDGVAAFAEECSMTGIQFKDLKKKAKQAKIDFDPPPNSNSN
jgi:predicted nucleic acid-binding protein